jgi:hypothetical protein
MAYNIPSQYQPIWDALKREHKVRLVAPTVLHARIFKAVKKRRNLDLAYKLECSELHKKPKLWCESDGNVLTIGIKFHTYYNSTGAY